MRVLVYDIEIVKAVPRRGEPPVEGVEYCEGWHDHANMGVSCIGAMCWNPSEDWPPVPRPRVFLPDNLAEFQDEASASYVVGFNSKRFDDEVLRAAGLRVRTDYDVLEEVWRAEGLDPDAFAGATHGGFGLDAMARAQGFGGKTGHGALAPVDWQQGRPGRVVDYCLADVWLTWRLLFRILQNEGDLQHPKRIGRLRLRVPKGVRERPLYPQAPA